MRLKSLSKKTWLIIISLGAIFILVPLGYFVFKLIFQSNPIPIGENIIFPSEQAQINYGLPVRLKIPKINVDAVIENVGLTSDQAMDVPQNKDNVAWYELGQRPGEEGSAVLAGHYGTWKNGGGSVFDDLSKLESGDTIAVIDDQGTTISFRVRETKIFTANADTSGVFASSDGKAHLNLITCEGQWNVAAKSYPQRLIVFADKI